jgi:hypothetical protein
MINFEVKEHLAAMKKEQKLIETIKKLKRKEILVGIPEENAERKEGEMNNPTLLYIHTHGSPLMNIPSRPVIEAALDDKENQIAIAVDLKLIAEAIMDEEFSKAESLMKTTGNDVMNRVHAWFENPKNGWPPLKPATIKAKGSNAILIDTGQMRNAITYVISEGEE